MTARDQLDAALTALAAAGQPWPCHDRDEWTSEHASIRAEAAQACRFCPVELAVCRAAGEAPPSRHRWGVWGGTDLDPTTTAGT